MSDVWIAAFIRLGESEWSAVKRITALSVLASSKDVFERWNAPLPDPVGKPMLAAIAGPGGDALATQIVEHFRHVLLSRLELTELQADEFLQPTGLN